MFKAKGFFNKKTITLLVSGVVIIALLIIAVVTGGVHNLLDCPDCVDGLCASCGGTTILADGSDCCADGLCATCGGAGVVEGSLWALLPPVIAIGLALITKEVFSSLFIGILSGAILASDFNFLKSIDHTVNTGLISAVSGTAGIFIFLIELGIIVAIVNKAGGSRAFGEWAKKNVKSKVGAQLCTFALGVLIFIDDYFNCLTVGSVMRPITDKHKVSRSKLAYLIDATAAPICMIAPISSWAAAVSEYAATGEGLKLFVMAIPFNFYSLLTLVFIVALVLMRFDFGPMKKHEVNAENGDLFSGEQISKEVVQGNDRGRVIDLIIPIALLIVCSVFALVYVGGIFDGANFIEAFAATDATVGLPWGGLVALVLIIIYMAIRQTVSFKESMECIPQGFIAMVPAILILTFATALKEMTSLLGAKYFIGDLMANGAGFLGYFLPAIIFIVACFLAFATGTSWGTFGILIPIVTAMFPEGGTIMIISMSACLAGAVCGDHCSPISDTTIMSSAGAECEHLNHVTTQIPYALCVAGISFVMYIIAGFVQAVLPFGWAAGICLALGVALTIAFLIVMKKISAKKAYCNEEDFSKESVN